MLIEMLFGIALEVGETKTPELPVATLNNEIRIGSGKKIRIGSGKKIRIGSGKKIRIDDRYRIDEAEVTTK